jgi:8-oxo-dGTP pyrophosphatase MutT (NUDIX family)
MKFWTSLLPITKDGQWVLQHRDNLPHIVDPDKVSFFGGHIDEGETPLECVLRESREELGLELKPGDVEFVRVFPRHQGGTTEGDIYFYLVHGIDPSALRLGEGQGFVFVRPDVDLTDGRFSSTCREILAEFRNAKSP